MAHFYLFASKLIICKKIWLFMYLIDKYLFFYDGSKGTNNFLIRNFKMLSGSCRLLSKKFYFLSGKLSFLGITFYFLSRH